MPSIHKLVDNVASQVSEKSDGTVWFNNLYIKKAYSQLYWDDFTSKQCKFSIVGGKITGTNQFWFHGLGDEFQRVIGSFTGNIILPPLPRRNVNFFQRKF